MTGPEGMDELRARLRRAEQDAAAARILAGGADRDVGELGREFREFRDQNNRLLSALREDLADLRDHVARGFAGIPEQFAGVQEQFTQVDRNFLAVRGVLDGVAAGQRTIVDLLSREQGDDPRER